MDNKEVFITLKVYQFLKIAEKTTNRLALEGKLPEFKVGGSWRFRKTEIEEQAAKCKQINVIKS